MAGCVCRMGLSGPRFGLVWLLLVSACGGGGSGGGSGDTSAPTVSSVTPANNATAVAINTAVNATFSETMSAATLTATSFTLSGSGGAVAGSVGYSGLTATFTPTNALDTNTSYTATVTTAAKDVAGNSLASNYAWSFTTRPFTRQLGTAASDAGAGVATDANGNVYVAGYTGGALDGQTSTGSVDLFVVKYDSKGVKQWTRQMGTAWDDFGYSVATDANGNVYVAGYTGGVLDGLSSAGGIDMFVVKYDTNGIKQWTRQMGTAWDDFGYSVATDTNGNVYVAGSTGGALDGQTTAGGWDAFIIKYDTDGVKQWARQLGTATNDGGNNIATDASGNVYVAGNTDGALDGQASAGGYDVFVAKYDTNGVKQWTRQLGTVTTDYGYGLATDANGGIFVSGSTFDSLDSQTPFGNGDLFVVKYDTSGVKQWARQLGTATSDYGRSVATDTSGNIYVTGFTDGALDGQASAGGNDVFVVKYDSNGNKK